MVRVLVNVSGTVSGVNVVCLASFNRLNIAVTISNTICAWVNVFQTEAHGMVVYPCTNVDILIETCNVIGLYTNLRLYLFY